MDEVKIEISDYEDDTDELSNEGMIQWAMRISEATLAKIWDNDEDAVYDEDER